jgi:hypothetical protein
MVTQAEGKSSKTTNKGSGKQKDPPRRYKERSKLGEPATREEGKPFDPTTAPREEEIPAKDASQELQEQTTTAPKRGPRQDKGSGIA